MSWTADLPEIISAVAAVGAFGAAAYQLRGLRSDALLQRVGEIKGVSVHTRVKTRPTRADAGGELSRWVYEFVVHNPGRYPITAVDVEIRFDIPVAREHFDRKVDPEAAVLSFGTPVIPAHETQRWERTVLVEFASRNRLRETAAVVSFTTPDAGPRTNEWPGTTPTRRDRRLLRELER